MKKKSSEKFENVRNGLIILPYGKQKKSIGKYVEMGKINSVGCKT